MSGTVELAVFNLSTAEEARLLKISGPLAHGDCDAFRSALEEATGESRSAPLIIDMSGLEFICSAGMSLLVHYERAMTSNGRRMVTAGLQGAALETVEMCGIGSLLTTSPTVDAALADLVD